MKREKCLYAVMNEKGTKFISNRKVYTTDIYDAELHPSKVWARSSKENGELIVKVFLTLGKVVK